MSHRAHTYDRWSRIRKRLLALRLAPTIAEGLTERDVQRLQRPSTGRLLVMAGAVGLTSDFPQARARAAETAGPVTTNR